MMKIEETDNNIVGLALWSEFLPAEGMAVIVNSRDPVAAFLTQLSAQQRMPANMRQYMRQNPEMAFQGMLDKFGLIYVVKIEGEVVYYARSRKNRLPMPALKRVEKVFGIWPETPVAWYRSVEGEPQPTPAGVAFYGRSDRQLRQDQPVHIVPKSKARTAEKTAWATNHPDLATSYSGLDNAYDLVDRLLK